MAPIVPPVHRAPPAQRQQDEERAAAEYEEEQQDRVEQQAQEREAQEQRAAQDARQRAEEEREAAQKRAEQQAAERAAAQQCTDARVAKATADVGTSEVEQRGTGSFGGNGEFGQPAKTVAATRTSPQTWPAWQNHKPRSQQARPAKTASQLPPQRRRYR